MSLCTQRVTAVVNALLQISQLNGRSTVVNHFMYAKLICLSKCFVAYLTNEWTLTNVNVLMSTKASSFSKSFVAHVKTKWVFISVMFLCVRRLTTLVGYTCFWRLNYCFSKFSKTYLLLKYYYN